MVRVVARVSLSEKIEKANTQKILSEFGTRSRSTELLTRAFRLIRILGLFRQRKSFR
jgi:hypothetical protein